jgi:hypothetical protein
MKRQKSCGPRLGKLVHQLPRVVTFSYDIYFRCMISRWKSTSILLHVLTKMSFRASKWPQKLKTAKNSELPKLPENCFEPVGKGGWPLISTWINTPSLGSNGIHFFECPGEREKFFMNLNLGELLAMLETLRCSVCGSLSQTC